jgi:hypothetical protein
MRRVRGSTSASTLLPFTVIVTWTLAIVVPPEAQPACDLARANARATITPAIFLR